MSARSRQRRPDAPTFAAAWLLLLAAMFAASPALACAVRIGPIQTTPITYDPFVASGAEGAVTVDVDLTDGDACDAALVLTDDSTAPLRTLSFGARDTVEFRPLLRRGGAVRESTDPAEAMVTLTAAAPQAQISWRLVSQGDGVLAPGDYSLPIRVQLRSPVQAVSPALGTLLLRSVPRAQINLAGTAGSYEAGGDSAAIDLGELRSGKTGRAFLQLRANTQAHLSFRSENRGVLRSAVDGAVIPYRLSFDSSDVDLRQPASRTVEPPATLRGASFELLVTVGDVSGATAGRYSDTVVIDVTP